MSLSRSHALVSSALRRRGVRALCSYQFDPFGGPAAEKWPVTRRNTIVNQCAEGELAVIERFGKLNRVVEPGWFLAAPFADRVAYVVDTRERSLEVVADGVPTLDGCAVNLSGHISCAFVDAERAAYGSANPLAALRQVAAAELRAAVAARTLDDVLKARTELNEIVAEALREAAPACGIEVHSFALSELAPDRLVADALDRLSAAATAQQKAAAEAAERAAENQRAGAARRAALVAEATAKAECAVIMARGDAEATLIRSKAAAQAIRDVESAITGKGALDAARVVVALEGIFAANRPAESPPESAPDMRVLDRVIPALEDHAHDETTDETARPRPVAVEH
ncbi:band 7 family-domain-containing protein [Pelagophyceae sp. CCMP2097]|nr:band 7 family-domain-containing protein [Pelagophyceae sp. CCMP2097]